MGDLVLMSLIRNVCSADSYFEEEREEGKVPVKHSM